MTIFYAVIAAFIVGAGLAYGFRGWIERTKAAEKAALQQSAQRAFSLMPGSMVDVYKHK